MERIDIWWPIREAPVIQEVAFSYAFCRGATREGCEDSPVLGAWVEHGPGDTVGKALKQGHADGCLVVLDPETILCAAALERLFQNRADFAALGPVFNYTDRPHQLVRLSAPYLNRTAYLEAADRMAGETPAGAVSADALDPACILYSRPVLLHLRDETPVDRIQEASAHVAGNRAAVDPGALVHRFGDYYEAERDDLVRMVPQGVHRVLDVGCARGGYGRRLKAGRPEIDLTGIELNPIMAEAARHRYDRVFVSRVEEADLKPGYDLINCGDVLEHMNDPWAMLEVFARLLRDGGSLVLSVPNMGHWTVVRDLLAGRFEYLPVGLTCVTHIRWFTEAGLCLALKHAGFRVDAMEREQFPVTPEGEAFIRQQVQAGWGDEISLRTNEIVIRAVKQRRRAPS
jgi:SAM-dependent methyltransferase